MVFEDRVGFWPRKLNFSPTLTDTAIISGYLKTKNKRSVNT